MSFTEDFGAFFKTSEHATEGVFLPPSGPGRVTRGIFDWAHVEVDDIDSRRPVWTCRASDLPKATRGWKLSIKNKSYLITQVMDDGTGVVQVVLESHAG